MTTDTVWKFQLRDVANKVAIPFDAQVLHVGEQYGQIALWVRVNPDAERVTRTFHVVGTGTPIPDAPTMFCGTAVTADGSLVFHIFEEIHLAPAVSAPSPTGGMKP